MGPACLLCYVQLIYQAWFQEVLDAPDAASALAVDSPKLLAVLRKINMGDMAWLPMLPDQYQKVAPAPSPASNKGKGKPGTPGNDKRQLVVTNPKQNLNLTNLRPRFLR